MGGYAAVGWREGRQRKETTIMHLLFHRDIFFYVFDFCFLVSLSHFKNSWSFHERVAENNREMSFLHLQETFTWHDNTLLFLCILMMMVYPEREERHRKRRKTFKMGEKYKR